MTAELWDPEKLAEFLGISSDELSKMRSEGTGPKFIKFRRKIRYNPRTVAEWLESCTLASTKESV